MLTIVPKQRMNASRIFDLMPMPYLISLKENVKSQEDESKNIEQLIYYDNYYC